MQSLFEFLGAGKFFERAPVFGAGFFALVVRDGGVEAFADGGQVQGFRRTDVFAFFDLDQTAVFLSSFVMRTNCASFAPSGLVPFSLSYPTACAVGCNLSPLRG